MVSSSVGLTLALFALIGMTLLLSQHQCSAAAFDSAEPPTSDDANDPSNSNDHFDNDQQQSEDDDTDVDLLVPQKRAKAGTSSFLRLGKSTPGSASSFIRFGRSQSFLRLGRGGAGAESEYDAGVDDGETTDDGIEDDREQQNEVMQLSDSFRNDDPIAVYRRTPSSFIRFGKRSDDYDDDMIANDVDKRRRAGDSSSFLRFGRGSSSSSFLRLGRADSIRYLGDNGRPRRNNVYYFSRLPAAKRLLARNFIRLGKRSVHDYYSSPLNLVQQQQEQQQQQQH